MRPVLTYKGRGDALSLDEFSDELRNNELDLPVCKRRTYLVEQARIGLWFGAFDVMLTIYIRCSVERALQN